MIPEGTGYLGEISQGFQNRKDDLGLPLDGIRKEKRCGKKDMIALSPLSTQGSEEGSRLSFF